jgi:hypothetical protein
MSNFESPNAYRQRVQDNARKSNAPAPVQDRSRVPSPSDSFTKLPPVVNVPVNPQAPRGGRP